MTETQSAPSPAVRSGQQVIIECRDLSRVYKMGKEVVYALRDMNLDIYKGEYLSVMGPSGSGKSTLFNMIGALDTPSTGVVKIDGIDITKRTSPQLAYIRNHGIGYVFQSFNLIPALTALRNVMLPVQFSGRSQHECEERAAEVLTEVGLGDRLHHRPGELSGGQQQRVAIARALAMEPAIILADEPTANLDLHTGEDIIGILRALCDNHGVTVVTATHDQKMLDKSDRILWIKDGKKDRLKRRDEVEIRIGKVE
jgi:putative ABC transport system ATP-binding protein